MPPTRSAAPCHRRLRVFAGPNGSGKSTIIDAILKTHIPCGLYVNADDLLQKLKSGRLPLGGFLPSGAVDLEAIRGHHDGHPQVNGAPFPFARGPDVDSLALAVPHDAPGLSYSVAVLADYLRHQAVACGHDLSFETVFSHPSKLDFMKLARASGYRIYLYFVGVASAVVCVERVALRVKQGGHNVDDAKIVERYKRCIDLLEAAVCISDRAFIFDNTDSPVVGTSPLQQQLKLEVTDAKEVTLHCDRMPNWIVKALPAIFA